MNRAILLLFLFFNSGLIAQSTINDLLNKADSLYFDYSEYESAYNTYHSALKMMEADHGDYSYTIDKIARSLFYWELDVRGESLYQESIDLCLEFIDWVEKNPQHIHPEIQEKKYWMYKNLVCDYFGLNNLKKARKYQDKLYEFYKAKVLPDGLDVYYNFRFFVWDDMNVWAYEWFPELGDPETEGSFSKQVYYFYSRDENGDDVNQLFTLQTVKIHKIEPMEVDYVLTYRIYSDQGNQSQTLWKYTFPDPVDYTLLHDSVLEFLEENYK